MSEVNDSRKPKHDSGLFFDPGRGTHEGLHDDHPQLDAPLWRYMTLGKFILLLEQEKLYFPSISKLREAGPIHGDPQEGCHPYQSHHEIIGLPNKVCVQCWNMDVTESKLMLEKYIDSTELIGVALKTTFNNLSESLNARYDQAKIEEARRKPTDSSQANDESKTLIRASKINYTSIPEEKDENRLYLEKRKEFEPENELRLFLHLERHQDATEYPKSGRLIPVKVDKLVKEIRVFWRGRAEYKEFALKIVRDILKHYYELLSDDLVKLSELNSTPT